MNKFEKVESLVKELIDALRELNHESCGETEGIYYTRDKELVILYLALLQYAETNL